MNRLISWLLLAALACAGSNAFAQYADWPEDAVFRTDQERYGHLEYFGFYASSLGSWNFTDELAPFTNLTWIQVDTTGDPAADIGEIIRRLIQARTAGVQATVSIEPFVFIRGEGYLRTDTEIEDFLVELRAQLEFAGLLDTVAMIYPKDEPFRELIKERKPNFIEQYVTGKVYKNIHRDLVHLNDLVKLVFPEKPIGVILSGFELHHRFFSIPENYDWVGFDCYQDLFRSCSDKSFVEHYSRLLKFMQPHQRLMAVPEAWAQNEDLNQPGWPDVLASRMLHHYEIALNEPRFIAFIPFIWSFDAESETPGLGLNRFPGLYDDGAENRGTAFVDLVRAIGLQIKQGAPEFPNMAYADTENSIFRPASLVRGEIMGVSGQGLISAWALDESLPHKNLRVQVLIREPGGKLIHKARSERTFIRDPALSELSLPGDSLPGLHGYRYQLPADVMNLNRRQDLNVEFITYADGGPRYIGSVYTLRLPGGQRLPKPLPGLAANPGYRSALR